MGELKIINFMEVNGEDVRWDCLTAEKQKEASEAMQDKAMASVGYRRQETA